MRGFQFHKGAIRTAAHPSPSRTTTNFNSIKVRLEHSEPTKGYAPTVFQFHKGAIRT